MPSNHLILCCLLLLLPSLFPNIGVFSNESALCIRWPKYCSFSFNISPSNEHPGLISFRMDCLDLLAVQGTLKSLLQHQSSKASILLRSAFFIVWLSNFPKNLYWRDYPFYIEYPWLPCQILVIVNADACFRASQFCFISLWVCFCSSTTPPWLLQLCSIVWKQED